MRPRQILGLAKSNRVHLKFWIRWLGAHAQRPFEEKYRPISQCGPFSWVQFFPLGPSAQQGTGLLAKWKSRAFLSENPSFHMTKKWWTSPKQRLIHKKLNQTYYIVFYYFVWFNSFWISLYFALLGFWQAVQNLRQKIFFDNKVLESLELPASLCCTVVFYLSKHHF